jgi:hypothetical protein
MLRSIHITVWCTSTEHASKLEKMLATMNLDADQHRDRVTIDIDGHPAATLAEIRNKLLDVGICLA